MQSGCQSAIVRRNKKEKRGMGKKGGLGVRGRKKEIKSKQFICPTGRPVKRLSFSPGNGTEWRE